MPDNHASAKVAILHQSKMHVSENSMSYDRPLLNGFITTFVINVSHLSGEIITFEKLIPTEKYFFLRKNNFPLRYLEFPTRIKELPIRTLINIGFEQNLHNILKLR